MPVALVNLKQFFVLFTCLLISGNFHSKWKISPNMKQTFIHSKNKVKPKWYDRKKKKKKEKKKKYDVDGWEFVPLASGCTEFSVVSRLDLWKIIGVLVCRNKTNPVVHFLLFFGLFFFVTKWEICFLESLSERIVPFFFNFIFPRREIKKGKKKGSAAIFSTRNKINWTPRPRHLPIRPTTHTPRTLPEPRSRPRYSSAASSRVCYFCAVFYLILFLGTRRINLKITHFEMFIVCVVTILESVGGLSSPPPPVSRCVRESVKRHSPALVVLWCPIHRNGRWKKRISVCVSVCVCGMMMWSGEFRQPDTVLFVFFVY